MGTYGGARPGAGRPKGAVAKSTLQALEAKNKMVELYHAASEAITLKLIEKALLGDMLAIKELHDRVFGKAFQPGEVDVTSGGKPFELTDEQFKQAIKAAAKASNSDESSEG